MATVDIDIFNWDQIVTDAVWFHRSGITPAISQAIAEVLQDALEVFSLLKKSIRNDNLPVILGAGSILATPLRLYLLLTAQSSWPVPR
jgi:hypothetical protein